MMEVTLKLNFHVAAEFSRKLIPPQRQRENMSSIGIGIKKVLCYQFQASSQRPVLRLV